jgi:hypothetical protein
VRQNLIEPQGQKDGPLLYSKILLSIYQKWTDPQQKISMDTVQLHSTRNQLDIMDIYKLLHSTTAEHTFFSSLHGMFTNTDYILSHKAHLNKFRTEIILCLLSDLNGISNRKTAAKVKIT